MTKCELWKLSVCLFAVGCFGKYEPCAQKSMATIKQGVFGCVEILDDTSDKIWPGGPVQLRQGSSVVVEVETNGKGFFEIAAEPGDYLICELGYGDCADLDIPSGLAKCGASGGPPPLTWSGPDCRNFSDTGGGDISVD